MNENGCVFACILLCMRQGGNDNFSDADLPPEREPALKPRSASLQESFSMQPVLSHFFGPPHAARIRNMPVLFNEGGYFTRPVPESLVYLYCILENGGREEIVLEDFSFEPVSGGSLWEIGLPEPGVKGQILRPGESFAVAFLLDVLIRRLRDWMHLDDPLRFSACCRCSGGETARSAEIFLSLDFPRSPLQDSELMEYAGFFTRRRDLFLHETERIRAGWGSLSAYAGWHLDLGMHDASGEDGRPCRRLREWMPAANSLYLATDRFNFERRYAYRFNRTDDPDIWELLVPVEELPHGTYYELHVASSRTRGHVKRIPAFAVWVEQSGEDENQWCARVWDPPRPYRFRHPRPAGAEFVRIYEAHVGIARPLIGKMPKRYGSYEYFARSVLPRIVEGGYTAVQLMGVPEHPLYKSFGYQVGSYFAPSSRFGTPDDFKALVDEAHRLGLAVYLDIAHSHSCPNTEQGLARYDTSRYFFRRKKTQWDTLSFDYSLEATRRFLLSNCRWWMEEFKVDGFRFDAVGNMMYTDYGLGDDFSHVGRCFYDAGGKKRLNGNGVLYLSLANTLVHELAPEAFTVAEEFSGAPGMSCPPEEGGLGFDCRFAMGIPDYWDKFIRNEGPGTSMGMLWSEITNRRWYDRTVSYTECHDQCINGDDAFIWRLIGEDMYEHMSVSGDSWKTSRGVALHKLMRLVTLAAAGWGWLNFMGNEFGHPEWIDDEAYAHRQWHLAEIGHVKYAGLDAFDRAMLGLVRSYGEDFRKKPRFRHVHEEDRLLAFERGHLLFVFNFHELKPQDTLDLMVTPGKYTEILSSDEPAYAGHGNLSVGRGTEEHFSDPASGSLEQRVTLYLPPLAALTLLRG